MAAASSRAGSDSRRHLLPVNAGDESRRVMPSELEYFIVVTNRAVPPHAAVAVCGCQRTQSAMTSPLAMPLFWLVYRALKPMMLTI